LATRAISRNLSRAGSSPRTGIFPTTWWRQRAIQQRRRSGGLCPLSRIDDPQSLLDSVFAEVRNTDIQRPDGVQGIAWTTDFIGLEKITYQVGYIGGYSSFIGYDKEKGNAVVC
jgi:hypothetical protein